ncbi:MAG: hypothetical protein WAV41_02235 [Microgenomates group bacterium]
MAERPRLSDEQKELINNAMGVVAIRDRMANTYSFLPDRGKRRSEYLLNSGEAIDGIVADLLKQANDIGKRDREKI